MSEKLNEQAREQQAYHNTVVNKVLKHQALNDEDIKYLCPVAFKDKMTKAEINRLGLSKHYSFVPTMNVVNDLRALGYEVVDAKQVSARKKSTKGYQKHMITLEHPKYKLDQVNEVEISDGKTETQVTKAVLADCGEYADPQFVDGIVKDVALLEAVLGRVIAQQELIDIRTQSICLN